MKILTVLGARPQFVKAATVSRAILQHSKLEEVIVHSGQHYDENMSEIFFREMDIPKPKYRLTAGALSQSAMTGEMLKALDPILETEKPDVLMVYGDTNTTLAGALTAVKAGVPIAHVEAGLRSFNMRMPEEINRILTDRISRWLFCPTETAEINLKREGFDNFPCERIRTGDVMYDAALYYSKNSASRAQVARKYEPGSFNLCTLHRAENTNDPETLARLLGILEELSQDKRIVFPIHPRTRKACEQYGLKSKNIDLIDPVGYFDMLELIKRSDMVLTDSGGLQKEAYFFKKPCITLRTETEWVELVEAGANKVVGHDREKVRAAYSAFKTIDRNSLREDLYGDGHASDKIAGHFAAL